MRKHIKLGVFGFGCVGQGLYDVLHKTQGIKAEIVKICVKDKTKKRSLPETLFTYTKEELLFHPDINVIVELIDDADAAFEIVATALKNKKAVVTANKKMIAEHFEELFQLQQEYGVPLLYEAACCASIPIIRNLEEYYDNDLLNSVEGIFNGSTNYILTKIFSENLNFQTALQQAQALGFAESDPKLDVEGFDPKFKLSIVLTHAFGIFIKPEQIFHYGIQNISEFDIKYAREKGYKIKLVASCRKIENKIYAAVFPKFVQTNDKLYNINLEYNGITIESIFSEDQFFAGKGAGSYPTGSAVLSDISALTYGYKYEYKKYFQNNNLTLDTHFGLNVYIRYFEAEGLPNADFLNIREKYTSVKESYIIGKISLHTLINASWLHRKDINIILLPEGIPEEIYNNIKTVELVSI